MITLTEPIKVKDLKSDVKPIWCPGCGDFGVLNAVLKALTDLELDPAHVAIASGIGCSGRFPAFVNAYGFHGVHGRVLPLATGIKLANPELTVFAVGGDGDAFSIGAGHLPHAVRRNVDITYVVMDNEIYGLTKGQPSPTSPLGMERKASPYGTYDIPLNPIAMVLSYGATFVARGFSSQPRPCVTFYDTYARFKDIAVPIPEDHDPADRAAAMELALQTDIQHLGVFYQEERASHHARVDQVRDRAGTDLTLAWIRYGIEQAPTSRSRTC
jgi:2-oxoglutarate ferredoxin oxidoreductase subunit beta